MVVVAVAGRGCCANVLLLIACCEDCGIVTPIASNFLSRDFISSSSSQTVEGAVVETVEPVSPVSNDFEMRLCRALTVDCRVNGEEW